jgi:hypothetical protein
MDLQHKQTFFISQSCTLLTAEHPHCLFMSREDEISYTRYHRYLCPQLKRCTIEMKVVTKEKAKAMGRKKCG